MIMNAVTATAVPIRIDLETAERPRDLKGDSSLYVKVPQMQVLSIRTPSSVPSITYSFQCKVAASVTEADWARVVTGYRRGLSMPSYACPTGTEHKRHKRHKKVALGIRLLCFLCTLSEFPL